MTRWLAVPGWAARYEVSEFGSARSKDMTVGAKNGAFAVRKGRNLVQVKKSNGYLCVTLADGIHRPQIAIHRLVARAFIGECPLGLHVLHSDGDKINNHYSNLRYGSAAENVLDTLRHGRRLIGATHPMSKLDDDAVLHIRSSSWGDAVLARVYGVSREHIWGVRARRSWKHIP